MITANVNSTAASATASRCETFRTGPYSTVTIHYGACCNCSPGWQRYFAAAVEERHYTTIRRTPRAPFRPPTLRRRACCQSPRGVLRALAAGTAGAPRRLRPARARERRDR